MVQRVRNSVFFPLALLLGLFLVLENALRLGFFVLSYSSLDIGIFGEFRIWATGFFFDIVTFSYLLAVFLPLHLLGLLQHRSALVRILVHGIFFYVFLFSCVSEWLFWQEFSTRFNFIAVDYLVYSQEVLGNIRESYPLGALLALLGAASLVMALAVNRILPPPHVKPFKERLKAAWVLVFPFLFFALINNHQAEFSQNSYANELAKNGIHSLFNAYRDNMLDYDRFYLRQDRGISRRKIQELVSYAGTSPMPAGDDRAGLLRHVKPKSPERRKNLILISVESLSAKFLSRFGNREGITPYLDEIVKESVLFTNFYATGTRTVRGLEAITLSLPPTPGNSVIRRPNNENLFNIGTPFRERGYDVRFLYGGYGYFDNMNAFYQANGFTIVDRSSMSADEVRFGNVWGVSDQDLFQKVLKEADASYAAQKHFFSLVMTTSNHRPYTYPQVIDIRSGSTRQGAVKYTDYALGEFFRLVKEKPWFKDTIIAVVADHCDSSAGKGSIPVKQYHIPFFIYAPGLLAPREISEISSQIDIAPTLLGLMNFEYDSLFFGVDLFQKNPQRALLSTYQKLGYYKNDSLAVLSPSQKLDYFRVDPQNFELKETQRDSALSQEAVSYYEAANSLFKNGHYRLEKNKN